MKVKSNNSTLFKALFLFFGAIFLILSLIIIVNITSNNQEVVLSDSDNDYEYTNFDSTSQLKRTFQNDQWYVENSNISTWVFFGLDKYQAELLDENDTSTTQADFIFIFVFDEENETCKTLQINRDTMVDIDVFSVDSSVVTGSVFAQITLAHTYGASLEQSADNLINSLSKFLYDTSIDYYVSSPFDIVSIVTDMVGGVELEVLYDYSSQFPEMIVGETVNLTGEQALAYVQQRVDIGEQTNVERMQRQIQYLEALQEIVKNSLDDSRLSTSSLLSVFDYIYTDASFSALQTAFNKYINYEYISNYTIDGESVLGDEFMEFYADDEQVMDLVLELFYLPEA